MNGTFTSFYFIMWSVEKGVYCYCTFCSMYLYKIYYFIFSMWSTKDLNPEQLHLKEIPSGVPLTKSESIWTSRKITVNDYNTLNLKTHVSIGIPKISANKCRRCDIAWEKSWFFSISHLSTKTMGHSTNQVVWILLKSLPFLKVTRICSTLKERKMI